MIDIFDKLNAAYGDQTLADSDQIKDKKFGKKQDVLNKEILDPDDPNSLKSKVDSFNGIVIDPDNVVSTDKSDIEVGSSKIPTGNAVAGALSDAVLKAGVFDISAYNLTNDQPTPYADLEAALGNNGENVPEAGRKGGMQVKFIQGSVGSSDNKYVQYRLMSESFNTTESNWQGVDDKPTAGSENLVKSGGVASVVEGFYPFEQGGINAQTGVNDDTIQTQFRTKEYWAISGSPTISATDPDGNSLETGARYYDVTKTFVGYSYTGSARFVRIVVVANINVTPEYHNECTVVLNGEDIKVKVGANSASGTSYDDDNTTLKGNNVQEIIESVDEMIYGTFPLEQGGISSSTGENDDTQLSQIRTKDYWPINGSPTFSATDPDGNTLEVGIRYYDSSKTFVGYTYTGSAKYVRIVVVANQIVSEQYINEVVIVLNGDDIKTIGGINSALGVSFDDDTTIIKGGNVQKMLSNIDSFISGNALFEQGGISAQTGENDNTRPMQFRSNMFVISANPTITATDKYGNSLEVGVRFYDASGNYLAYLYPGSSAKFVRIVVVCNGVAYKNVIADTKVIFNGQVLVQKDSANLGSGIEFKRNGTNIIGNNVQSAIEFVNDDKKGINPIIVSTWNVGQFGGGRGQSTIIPSNYNQEVLKWNKKVRGIYADLCGMQEYNPVFGKNVDNDDCSPNDVVWDFYKYFEVFRQPEVASYWGGNGIGSQMKLSNAQKVKYECNEGVIAPDSTTQHLLDEVAFYTLADMQLMGVTVKVACCTIAFNASDPTDNTYQAAQYAELVEKFGDYDHVILMGDFETVDDSSLSAFTSNGFSICNGGAFGWFKTCPNTNMGNGNLDNIIVKGFDVADVKMDVNDLSDHYPLIAQLIIK